MIECDDQVEDDGAQDREQDLVKGQGQEGADEDDHINGKLEIAGADVEVFLQIERQDIDPAKAGAMAKQHEQANPHQRTPGNRGIDRVERVEFHQHRGQLREGRDQTYGDEGLDGKRLAHAFESQPVKGQVDHKEDHAKRQPGGMFNQKGSAGGTAGNKDAFAIKRDTKRHHHGAQQKGQHILIRAMGDIVLFGCFAGCGRVGFIGGVCGAHKRCAASWLIRLGSGP